MNVDLNWFKTFLSLMAFKNIIGLRNKKFNKKTKI
ncbi:hypothetical protein VCRA217O315_400004 [Vibrio crassostreae]|nr:hypothetical protein VCRA217O315_400004 [Vibrio crassostreae]